MESEQQWKSSYSAAECAELMSLASIVARCGKGDFDAAMRQLESDVTECVPFSEPAKIQGIWVASFEHSQFYEDQNSYTKAISHWHDPDPSAEALEQLVGTSFSTTGAARNELSALAESRVVDGAYTYEAFAIEFVGRKSLCPGSFGHLGTSHNEVIASDFLSVERLLAD